MSKQNFGKSGCGNQWSLTKMIYRDKAFICQENLILFLFDCLFCHILLQQYKNSPAAVHTESFFSKVLDKIFRLWRCKYRIRFQLDIEWKRVEPICKQIILSETCMVWNPMQTMCNKISLFEWLRTLSCNILYKRTWKYFEYSI